LARNREYSRAERELEEFGVLPWFRHGVSVPANPGHVDVQAEADTPLSEDNDLYDELARVLEELNRRNELELGVPGKLFRTDQLVGDDEIFLRRHIKDRESFAQMISALTRLVYDGSDGVVPPEARGRIKPRLPTWCYGDSRSLITQAIALRNHCTHIQAPDPRIAAEHLRAAGDIFFQYTRKRAPERTDWDTLRVGLLRKTIEFLLRLHACLPLQPDLDADRCFSIPISAAVG